MESSKDSHRVCFSSNTMFCHPEKKMENIYIYFTWLLKIQNIISPVIPIVIINAIAPSKNLMIERACG